MSFAGISLAEAVYPGYSVSRNFVSDLGATCENMGALLPRECVYVQPASTIFSVCTDVLGILILAAGYLLYPMGPSRRLPILLGLTGIGALGVGLVSEEHSPYHGVFALMVFLPGSLAALESSRVVPRPLRYAFITLGSVALFALGWFGLLLASGSAAGGPTGSGIWAPLGVGGTERLIVYPVLLWVVLFGLTLVARSEAVAGSADGPTGARSA